MKKNIRRKDGTWQQYHKRSVGNPDEVPPFIGWNKLLAIIEGCNQIPYDTYYKSFCIERDKALIATLFETGGRIGEVVKLEKANFDFTHKDYCIISNMLYEKRYEKIGKYWETTKTMPTGAFANLYEPEILGDGSQIWKRKRWRTTITSDKALKLRVRKPFPIFKHEPLYPIMHDWITRNHSNLLFPSPKKRKSGERTMTTSNGWVIINRIQEVTGIEMWTHWFRSQRASQLFWEYNLTYEEMRLWFSWNSKAMAQLYTKGSAEDLVQRMQKRIAIKATA